MFGMHIVEPASSFFSAVHIPVNMHLWWQVCRAEHAWLALKPSGMEASHPPTDMLSRAT